MRVLLTGATGYLGRPVLKALLAAGHEVTVLGRQAPPESPGLRWVPADLLSPLDLKALLGPLQATHLLHLAWYVEHGLYWTSPLNFRWVDASLRLLEAFCDTGGQRVVVAGTCAEYDWSHGYCIEELTPCRPATVYGAAKHACHLMAQALCSARSVSLAWGRLFMSYGPGEAPQRLVPALREVFQGRRAPFGIHASAYRDLLHVDDVAAGFSRLLLSDLEGAVNLCSGQPLRLQQLAEMLALRYGADPEVVLSLSRVLAGDPPLLVGDCTRLKVLGWSPTVPLAIGLCQPA